MGIRRFVVRAAGVKNKHERLDVHKFEVHLCLNIFTITTQN